MKSMIKLADFADFSHLANFFVANNLPNICLLFNPFPLTEETARYICQRPHKDRYYLNYVDAKIVGFAMLRGWEEGFQIPSFGILIDHCFQNLGIGRQMTEYVIDDAKNIGCKKIRLSVYSTNTKAVSLYLALGFVEIGKESIILNNERIDKLIMIKELGS